MTKSGFLINLDASLLHMGTNSWQKFYLVLNLCRVTTVDELVTRISTGRRIPIDSVKKEREYEPGIPLGATLTLSSKRKGAGS